VKPKRWMLLTWGGILALVIGFAAIDGGRNCEVPKSGPFHWLMKGEKYVPTHAGRFRCRQVKQEPPLPGLPQGRLRR
jgi:hypothetical protein